MEKMTLSVKSLMCLCGELKISGRSAEVESCVCVPVPVAPCRIGGLAKVEVQELSKGFESC